MDILIVRFERQLKVRKNNLNLNNYNQNKMLRKVYYEKVCGNVNALDAYGPIPALF